MKINIFESMIVSSSERERVYVEFYYNAQNPEQETKESDNSVLYDTCQIAELYWAELAEHFRITLFFPDNKTILDFNASELLGNLIYTFSLLNFPKIMLR